MKQHKKIYCISDMHGKLKNLDLYGYDIVIIAGDFSKMTGFGKWHLYDQKKWIENKFFKWTDSYPNTEFVVIAGNHDLCLDNDITGQYNDLNWNIAWHKNVHYLCNSGCEIDGIRFYGSPNIPIISYRWAFESNHDKLVKVFGNIPLGVDFLITHSPPRIPNELVDFSIQTNNGPFGSLELTQNIIDKRPSHVICGHIHSGTHDTVIFNDTMIHNVSRLDEDYEISYEPTIIET